jgi:hypothetical protein
VRQCSVRNSAAGAADLQSRDSHMLPPLICRANAGNFDANEQFPCWTLFSDLFISSINSPNVLTWVLWVTNLHLHFLRNTSRSQGRQETPQTSIAGMGLELRIPVFERTKTSHALDPCDGICCTCEGICFNLMWQQNMFMAFKCSYGRLLL